MFVFCVVICLWLLISSYLSVACMAATCLNISLQYSGALDWCMHFSPEPVTEIFTILRWTTSSPCWWLDRCTKWVSCSFAFYPLWKQVSSVWKSSVCEPETTLTKKICVGRTQLETLHLEKGLSCLLSMQSPQEHNGFTKTSRTAEILWSDLLFFNVFHQIKSQDRIQSVKLSVCKEDVRSQFIMFQWNSE